MNPMAAAAQNEPIREPVADKLSDRIPSSAPGKITISCYENDIPAFVENELLRLYGSIYSSLAQFRIYYRGSDVSTYIVRKNEEITTVYLFSRKDGRVRVANEVFIAGEEDIRRFVMFVFSTMPEVKSVSFKAIRTDLRRLPYPFQRANHLEDIVVDLPSSTDEYLAQISSRTRRNIRRQTEKLKISFDSFRLEVRCGEEIDDEMIKKTVALNHARMAGKNKLSLIDERETERMIRFAKECGLLCMVWIEGKLCAGALSFRSGSGYFLNVIAHDPAYDEYWLGTLCCYWAVCQAIERGAKEFHFLWGRYDYKYMLKGVLHELDNVTVYRSHAAMLASPGSVFTVAAGALRRHMQLRLHAAQREKKFSARVGYAFVNGFRKLAQIVHR